MLGWSWECAYNSNRKERLLRDNHPIGTSMPESDEALLQNTRSVAVRLAARAREADRNRMLPPETTRELHEGGLLSMGVPQLFGGTEVNPITLLHVYQILASACASTAWCVGNHTAACRKLHDVMGSAAEPYLRAIASEGAIVAQGIVPTGDTRPVPGGFVTSGVWPFMSFSTYARWALLSTMVPGPAPDWKPADSNASVPAAHNRQLILDIHAPGLRIEDNWYAMSLRASMSNDVTVDNVFVPENCAPFVPTAPGTRDDIPPALRHPPNTSFSPTCVVLGVARAAIADTIEYATSHPMSIGGLPRSETPGNTFAIADAAMYVESAHAFLLQETRSFYAKALQGEPFIERDTVNFRMASQVARENAQRAVERLWVVRGSHGIYESENFERYYRDVKVGTLPAPSAPDRVRESVGRFLFAHGLGNV